MGVIAKSGSLRGRMLKQVFLKFSLVAILFAFVHSIHVSTADYEEIYAGPGGVPRPGWDSMVKPKLYSNYFSVAQFLFSGTTEDAYYGSDITEVFGPPQLTVESGEDIKSPLVSGDAADGYYFDGTDYWEELPNLSIFFNCKKEGNAILSLSIQTSLLLNEEGRETQSVNETIKFYFEKECYSSGYREGFSIGNQKGRVDDVVKHGVTQQRWIVESYYFLDKNPIVVTSDEHLTTFHTSISNPLYGNQFFFEPNVFVEDDEMIDVQVRGSAQSGGIATGMPETLVLLYDCIESGDTEISVNIDLGFYNPITFGFTKSCKADAEEDNEMPGTINVGSSRSDYAGIVSDSVTSLLWRTDSPTVEIGADEILTNFYVSTISGKTQQILKPIITINPPNAFRTTLSGNIRDGGVVTGSPQHFTLNYICDRVSEGSVIVSIKMPHSKTVEFAFTKKCKPLKRHTDNVWTANQLLVAFVLCFFAIVVSAYILYKKKNAAQK